ncbi:hypothetical protein C9413_06005 [Rhizobium sp. SEMIA 4085]|nr:MULTISPECIES: hypothetical protein [Rhizobium]NNH29074.1 hypothetical protein [Rhizobium sp. SEMIA 4085]
MIRDTDMIGRKIECLLVARNGAAKLFAQRQAAWHVRHRDPNISRRLGTL